MRLKAGLKVDHIGTVSDRRVFRPNSGQAFVKATMLVDGKKDRLPVLWWDAGRAPCDGARVRVRGTVRIFNNTAEVHAEETTVERNEPPEDPLAAVAGFYLGCVEAEAAGSLRLTPGGATHVELVYGGSPFHQHFALPDNRAAHQWCESRRENIGETLLSGWPLVVGEDRDSGSKRRVASPLLITEVELHSHDRGWHLGQLGDGPDLNPFALDLLGIDRDERDALVTVVERSVAVEETTTAEDRARTILQVLEDAGLEGLNALNPEMLSGVSDRIGIHNTGVVMVTTGNMASIRRLVEDLEELVNTPKLMKKGPAAVLLGEAPAPEVPLPCPHPTIVPSSLSQDQAVHSAMENTFTVVTGPPGTGKSQVLVNVVAAAVARRETVLFASKNNRAVDVVVERLRLTSPHAVIVRAGNTGKRSELAQYIADALAKTPRGVDPVSAHRGWPAVAEKLQGVYDVLHERVHLEGQRVELDTELSQYADRLAFETIPQIDLPELDSALSAARNALNAFGKRLGLCRRWRRHQQRVERAREALRHLAMITGLDDRAEVEDCLSSVADRPRRTLKPRQDFQKTEYVARQLRGVLGCQRKLEEVDARLAVLPPKHELDDRLHKLAKVRTEAGRQLLDVRWEELRTRNSAARTAASECADLIERVAATKHGLRQALGRIPAALPALPVWSVTNLSTRTNLPLKAGLFDLVVIDEASQCDAASALPLLVRGKRALIIGDRKQLIHITSLSHSREQGVARRWGLSDERATEFSYRARSCFGLASARVQASPIFLNLHFRSHPAIIGFANDQFYGRQMELCSEGPPTETCALEWVRVSGQSAKGPRGRSWINQQEAQAVVRRVAQALSTHIGLGCSVGVVTPYGAQAELIDTLLSKTIGQEGRDSVKIATAHRFQGDERDIMFFSPVIGRAMPARAVRFAADPNLINVALTRARRRLVIVGDIDACLAHPTVLKELASYVARLEASGFDSPLELDLYEALLERGIAPETGVVVGRHRLDLAVSHDNIRLDIECDGAAFHTQREKDAARDRAIEAQGWQVIRFSGRELSRDIEGCVDKVMRLVRSATPYAS